ncbi:MAG: hypothetical protein C4519_19985 [Desulfobacteraceae bacterium]|nr:MAG: hypothetical protein C4519_19985 [Desulfobacteraceae bacterium]
MMHSKFYPALIAALAIATTYIILNHFFYLYGFIDGPFHLSAIREIGRHFPPRSPILHLPASTDFHYNISVFIQGLLYLATENMHLSILVTGALFSGMLIYSFSLLAGKYSVNRKELAYFLVVTLFSWGPYHVIWAGTFSASGLMINGFYSQTAAYVFFLLALYLAGKKEQSWQTRLSTTVLIAFCIVQHMLTACILIFLIIFVEIDRTEEEVPWRWSRFFLCIVSVCAALLLAKLWPFYDTGRLFNEALVTSMPHTIALILLYPAYYLLIKKMPFPSANFIQRYERVSLFLEYVLAGLILIVVLQALRPVYFNHVLPADEFRTLSPFDIFILIGAFFIIGILNGLSRKNLLLFWWAISLFAAAYLLWWAGKGLYWRVLLFSFFPLCILTSCAVAKLKTKACKTMIALAMVLLVYSNFQFIKSLCGKNKNEDLVALTQTTPENAVILSDPKTSYLISGFGDRNVIVSLASHWGHSVPNAERSKRKRDVGVFFESCTSAEQQQEILKKYHITYIVYSEDNYIANGSNCRNESSVVYALKQRYRFIGTFGQYSLFNYDNEN